MPSDPAAVADPVVLPVDPRGGWAGAPVRRRLLAAAAAGYAATWALSLLIPWPEADLPSEVPVLTAAAGAMTAALLLVGPFACHAVARVLRPHPPQVGEERRVRHAFAALATAYGLALASMVVTGSLQRGLPLAMFGAFWISLLVVALLGPLTIVWGALAALGRWERRRPERSRSRRAGG